MLQGAYLSDAVEQRRAELRRRRSSATATMATKRGRPPEPKGRARVIKMESIPPTDATRERNWREKVSPALETKSELGDRKWGFFKFGRHLRRQGKKREGETPPR